ncbi:MAG: type II secretion system protein J [Planctomycetaceae bacterium]
MSPRSLSAARRGMTLVEMLVATTCTLILMAAIAQVFGAFGTAVSDSRSMIELDARLRATAWRLRGDLAGATARPLPPLEVEGGEGYLEIIEGPLDDASGGAAGEPLAPADIDDAILFTTRNTDTPFIGKYDPTTNTAVKIAESPLAEVAWFLRPTDTAAAGGAAQPVPTYTLFRRQLLVLGYVGFTPFNASGNSVPSSGFGSWRAFFDAFDLSVKRVLTASTDDFVPNSLADLTRRETRFAHNPAGTANLGPGQYAFPDWQAASPQDGLIFGPAGGPRVSEDVILTNVIAFDVRVFDPAAPVAIAGDTAFGPGNAAPVSSGAYVDLGWNGGAAAPNPTCAYRPRFADLGETRSGMRPANATGRRVWDSWSTHYESNGLDDDGDGKVDEGSNGIDDDGDGKVDESPYDADGDGLYTGAADDDGELETLAPYRFPLRGIEIRIRCYEPSSRQVRQVTVRHSFVPR